MLILTCFLFLICFSGCTPPVTDLQRPTIERTTRYDPIDNLSSDCKKAQRSLERAQEKEKEAEEDLEEAKDEEDDIRDDLRYEKDPEDKQDLDDIKNDIKDKKGDLKDAERDLDKAEDKERRECR